MIFEGVRSSVPSVHNPTALGWRLPAIGFFVYSVIAIGSHILGSRGFLVIGGALMFLFVLAAGYRSIWSISVDRSVGCILWILLLAIVTMLYDPATTVPHNLVKHSVVCVIYLVVFSMGLSPIYSPSSRKVFVFTLLLMGAISILIPRSTEVDDVSRMSGIFVNSNNLSLSMMALLFLIDEDRDTRLVKIMFHAVIILFLLLAGTSGAILSYLGAMLFKFLGNLTSTRGARSRPVLVPVSILLVLLGCLLPADLYMDIPLIRRIVSQLCLIREELPVAISGYQFDYGDLSSVHGMSDFSGIWRISHWRTSLELVSRADTFQFLFGHGIGSANLLLYKLPHNDYLRILIEQGIVGLVLAIAFFLTLFRRIDRKYWHCIIAVALYCVTENNMDNLLFMCIFAFFLASAQKKPPSEQVTSTA